MKRFKWLLLSVPFILLFSACSSKPIELPEIDELQLIVQDDFAEGPVNAIPTNWTQVARPNAEGAPYVSDERARTGEYALRIGREQDAPNITNGAALSFDSLRLRTLVSFWFYASDTKRSLTFALIGSDSGQFLFGASAGPFLILNNGKVQGYSQAEDRFIDAGTYKPEQWHQVTLDIDIRERTYNVFVDDAIEPNNEEPIPFRNNDIRDISQFGVAYHAVGSSPGHLPVYIDDVEVRGK